MKIAIIMNISRGKEYNTDFCFRTKKKQYHTVDYKKRKRLFVAMILIIPATLAIVFLCYSSPQTAVKRYITSGICGAIQQSAVYHLPQGATLGDLVLMGRGLSYNANISHIDLSQEILQDSIYHIPTQKRVIPLKLITQVLDSIPLQHNLADKGISILYVGFPALYFLVTYYPELKRISILYIPHSTVLLCNEYRLIDLYFTLGMSATKSIIERQLQRKIDFYFVQDRKSFIGMIDKLKPLNVPVDSVFAEAYDLKVGNQKLDGFLTWEFIRFIDKKCYRVKNKGAKSLDNLQMELKNITLAYDLRMMRQKRVVYALHNEFNEANYFQKGKVVKDIVTQFNINSNLNSQAALDILSSITQGSKISFSVLPGYYQKEGDKVFYFPDKPGFDLLTNKNTREFFKTTQSKYKQTLY